jgi:hypothetical protein
MLSLITHAQARVKEQLEHELKIQEDYKLYSVSIDIPTFEIQ